MWGKGEFHSRGSFAVTLLDTADVWCSKLPLASASFAATQPSLPACLPSTYASNRSVAATTTLLLFSLLPCVPLTVPFCRQKCCKFELNCESPTTALINFLLNTASSLTKVYHFCRSKNLSIHEKNCIYVSYKRSSKIFFLTASPSRSYTYLQSTPLPSREKNPSYHIYATFDGSFLCFHGQFFF